MNKLQTEKRIMRGAIIAQKCKIKKALDGWHVPSQTRHIYYRIVFEGGFVEKVRKRADFFNKTP